MRFYPIFNRFSVYSLSSSSRVLHPELIRFFCLFCSSSFSTLSPASSYRIFRKIPHTSNFSRFFSAFAASRSSCLRPSSNSKFLGDKTSSSLQYEWLDDEAKGSRGDFQAEKEQDAIPSNDFQKTFIELLESLQKSSNASATASHEETSRVAQTHTPRDEAAAKAQRAAFSRSAACDAAASQSITFAHQELIMEHIKASEKLLTLSLIGWCMVHTRNAGLAPKHFCALWSLFYSIIDRRLRAAANSPSLYSLNHVERHKRKKASSSSQSLRSEWEKGKTSSSLGDSSSSPSSLHSSSSFASPRDIIKLLQACAYLRDFAAFPEATISLLLRTFSTHIKEFREDYLGRAIYACVKGNLQRNEYFSFFIDEVVQRFKVMRPWQLYNVMRSLANNLDDFNEQSENLVQLLLSKILKGLHSFTVEGVSDVLELLLRVSSFHPLEYSTKLNKFIGNKLRSGRDPVELVSLVEHTLSLGILKASNLMLFLKKISEESSVGLPDWLSDKKKHQDEGTPNEQLIESLKQQNNLLISMKLIELHIRHVKSPMRLEEFPFELQQFFERIRLKNLHIFAEADKATFMSEIPEFPFVFAELLFFLPKMRYHFHPLLYGPFLLELADPVGRVVVEWDKNWEFYPPWRKFRQKIFTEKKHFFLQKEGWTVIKIPLQKFQENPDNAAKFRFLKNFLKDQPKIYKFKALNDDYRQN